MPLSKKRKRSGFGRAYAYPSHGRPHALHFTFYIYVGPVKTSDIFMFTDECMSYYFIRSGLNLNKNRKEEIRNAARKKQPKGTKVQVNSKRFTNVSCLLWEGEEKIEVNFHEMEIDRMPYAWHRLDCELLALRLN